MTRLQVSTENADGSRSVVDTYRADARGRRDVDRKAAELLSQSGVARVIVEQVDRIAATGRRSYR